jgi:hypothetical protein
MKHRFYTSIALLAAGAMLAGCIVERDPYWSPAKRYWHKPHHQHHHHGGRYWR